MTGEAARWLASACVGVVLVAGCTGEGSRSVAAGPTTAVTGPMVSTDAHPNEPATSSTSLETPVPLPPGQQWVSVRKLGIRVAVPGDHLVITQEDRADPTHVEQLRQELRARGIRHDEVLRQDATGADAVDTIGPPRGAEILDTVRVLASSYPYDASVLTDAYARAFVQELPGAVFLDRRTVATPRGDAVAVAYTWPNGGEDAFAVRMWLPYDTGRSVVVDVHAPSRAEVDVLTGTVAASYSWDPALPAHP